MLSLARFEKKVRESSPNSLFFPSLPNAARTSCEFDVKREGSLGEMCSTIAPTNAR